MDLKNIHLKAGDLIAREFVKQRDKKNEEKIYLTVEQYFEAIRDPKKTVQDFELIEKGSKFYIVKDTPVFKRKLVELKTEEQKLEDEEIKRQQWEAFEGKCNTCKYELTYEQYPEDNIRTKDPILFVRDCISQDGYSYFKDKCNICISKEPVPPVSGCPHWKQNEDINTDK